MCGGMSSCAFPVSLPSLLPRMTSKSAFLCKLSGQRSAPAAAAAVVCSPIPTAVITLLEYLFRTESVEKLDFALRRCLAARAAEVPLVRETEKQRQWRGARGQWRGGEGKECEGASLLEWGGCMVPRGE